MVLFIFFIICLFYYSCVYYFHLSPFNSLKFYLTSWEITQVPKRLIFRIFSVLVCAFKATNFPWRWLWLHFIDFDNICFYQKFNLFSLSLSMCVYVCACVCVSSLFKPFLGLTKNTCIITLYPSISLLVIYYFTLHLGIILKFNRCILDLLEYDINEYLYHIPNNSRSWEPLAEPITP